ncbi:Aste57867_7807 [Aphanomyces stellatus]|uniref:Aste57867_7807 protein n=1 Tax=Aphanomyces stellatus TaxID=120398 RepID=A0A485KIS8_9STRA|nr:hypothetical protein As57867_007777 [Aphanomyces stellatus]VFT84705.1 Aste57867_7807 [Aphanomyces stellatus]
MLEYKSIFRDKRFRDSSRQFNSLFAYTSVGTKEVQLPPGPPMYKIHGQLVHNIGAYDPPNSTIKRSYLQMYVLDSDLQLSWRSNVANTFSFSEWQKIAVTTLQRIISRHNEFSRRFKNLKDNIAQLRRDHDERDLDVQVAIRPRHGKNARSHNNPEVAEVAICFREDEDNVGRDIVVVPRQGDIHQVSEVSGVYDPLQYPTLFPLGESGWDLNMSQNPSSRKRLT